jgi:hypothetical protein
MGYGSIYTRSYFGNGVIDNDIGWGAIYKSLVDPTRLFEILTESGDYVLSQNGEYLVTE